MTTPASLPVLPPVPQPAPLPRRAWVEQVMGLPVSVHVRGPGAGAPQVAAAVAAVFAELRALDLRFSTHRPTSEVVRWRSGLVAAPSDLLAEVLHLCERARELTGGAFDADLPGGFDPSGLVKGWAVERAAAPLRAAADHLGCDWLVNAGGDVLLHAGGGRSWRVGVEDPTDPTRLVDVVTASTGAVATSGSARRGAHITDPRTGAPASDHVLSATVIGPSLLWADVLATAAVVQGRGAAAWLASLQGWSHQLVERGAPPDQPHPARATAARP